jgi:hypothetical protein
LGSSTTTGRRPRGADHLDAYVPPILLPSWLDERRRPWRRDRTTDDLPDLPALDDRPDAVEPMTLLELLASLTPRRRAVVVLRFHSTSRRTRPLRRSVGRPAPSRALPRGLEAMRARVGTPSIVTFRRNHMTIHQKLLDGELGTPPPSTVDVDAIIARQRLWARVRQAGLIGGVGVMTLAIALVLTTFRDSGDPNLAPPGANTTPTLSPREQEEARLSAALWQLLTEALPGAEFLDPEPDSFAENPPSEALVFVDQGTYFLAAAQIRDAEGISTITVAVGKEETQFRSERACSTDPAPGDMNVNCEVVPGPDGAITETISNSSKFGGYKFHAAEIIRPDENAVHVIIANRSGEDVYRPEPHLTLQQTIALAQAPELATTLS